MQYTEQDLIEMFEEMAAIREYDGQMPRQEAERAAYFDLRRLVGPSVPMPEWVMEKAKLRMESNSGTT